MKHEHGHEASPYVRYELALCKLPPCRMHGWVARQTTNGADAVSVDELLRRHGEAIRTDCRTAGFQPAFVRALKLQPAAARQAAARWAARLIAEGRY